MGSARKARFEVGERFARHWHAVTRLDATCYADAGIADKAALVMLAAD